MRDGGHMPKHPMQPVIWKDGVARFQKNAIVDFLLDWARPRGMDLNELTTMNFSADDWNQFAQLIGYSVSGFGSLSYAKRSIVAAADAIVDEAVKKRSKKRRKS